jgi:hypothetical protein
VNQPLLPSTRWFAVRDMVTGEKHLFVITSCMERTKGSSLPMSPENPHPDAWCSACEQIRLAHAGVEREWNERSEALIKIRLVCGDYYEEIKARNARGAPQTNSVQ